jgi:transcription initiation factor IIE alpha subunit
MELPEELASKIKEFDTEEERKALAEKVEEVEEELKEKEKKKRKSRS